MMAVEDRRVYMSVYECVRVYVMWGERIVPAMNADEGNVGAVVVVGKEISSVARRWLSCVLKEWIDAHHQT